MFATAYLRIFQGLLLVLLDFRIQYIDILPDFLGYILVYRALGVLAAQHLSFTKAKPYALGLIFLSIMTLVEPPQANLLEYSLSSQSLGRLLLGQGIILVDLVLLYWLCQGIGGLSKERGLAELQNKAHFRWRFFLVTASITLVYTPFALNLDPAWNALMIPFMILMFVGMLLILGLVRTAQVELGE